MKFLRRRHFLATLVLARTASLAGGIDVPRSVESADGADDGDSADGRTTRAAMVGGPEGDVTLDARDSDEATTGNEMGLPDPEDASGGVSDRGATTDEATPGTAETTDDSGTDDR